MARRHVDDQPLQLPRDHVIEGVGHDPVVATHDKLGPDLLHKLHEIVVD